MVHGSLLVEDDLRSHREGLLLGGRPHGMCMYAETEAPRNEQNPVVPSADEYCLEIRTEGGISLCSGR